MSTKIAALISSSKTSAAIKGEKPKIAAIYARVSTGRQAREGVSLESQLKGSRGCAANRGLQVGREFIEAKSARGDSRPVFQDMMRESLSPARPFQFIIVHSLSRAFRNEVDFFTYKRRLAKNGVELISLTQDFGTGPQAELTMRFTALVDEYRSEETAAHVRHTMIENAKQGFANGTVPPLGFVSNVVEQRGDKLKKKWEIEPKGAEIVRKAFDLYLHGDGTSGAMGISKIRQWLNNHGHKTARGGPFYNSTVERLLTNEAYIGLGVYNRKNYRDGSIRPAEEWIRIKIPAIVSEDVFHRVQAMVASKAPDIQAPRLTNSEVVLGGIAFCADCEARMKARTGTARSGERKRYYSCSKHIMLKNCPGGPASSIAMDLLNKTVLDAVMDHVLTPERVQKVVAEAAKLKDSGRKDAVESVNQLKKQLSETNRKMDRLIKAIEDGVAAGVDEINDRLKELSKERGHLSEMIAHQTQRAENRIRPVSLERAKALSDSFRQRLLRATPSIQKRYVQALVHQVLVGRDRVEITAAKSGIAETLICDSDGKAPPKTGVRTFDREWWARQGSNL